MRLIESLDSHRLAQALQRARVAALHALDPDAARVGASDSDDDDDYEYDSGDGSDEGEGETRGSNATDGTGTESRDRKIGKTGTRAAATWRRSCRRRTGAGGSCRPPGAEEAREGTREEDETGYPYENQPRVHIGRGSPSARSPRAPSPACWACCTSAAAPPAPAPLSAAALAPPRGSNPRPHSRSLRPGAGCH